MLTHNTNRRNQEKSPEQETSKTDIFKCTNFSVDGRQIQYN
jgi:hypothetical protein